jgi:hypothetical protein
VLVNLAGYAVFGRGGRGRRPFGDAFLKRMWNLVDRPFVTQQIVCPGHLENLVVLVKQQAITLIGR